MEPRPVVGQREYRLDLQVPGADPESLIDAYVTSLRRVRGRVLRDDALRLRAEWPGGRVWLVAVSAGTLAGTPRLSIRALPEHLDLYAVLPLPPLLEALWAPLAEVQPGADGAAATDWVQEVTWPMFDAWAKRVLLSPFRRLPLVVLTPGRYGDPDTAQRLATDLRGFVHVVRFSDTQSTFRLRDLVGPERSVYGGAARIYRRGFSPKSDPLDHDLMVEPYLDMRLTAGSLSDEIARRVLPLVGEPIEAVTSDEPEAVSPEAARIHQLQAERVAHEGQVADIEAEVVRLRNENEALRNRVATLEARIPHVESPELPWTLLNPLGLSVSWTPVFADQVRRAARDAGLGNEVQKKIEAALAEPTGYGKPMSGARKGQRGAYVANNYRLVWSASADRVRFVLCVSKEDPEYSPHGA